MLGRQLPAQGHGAPGHPSTSFFSFMCSFSHFQLPGIIWNYAEMSLGKAFILMCSYDDVLWRHKNCWFVSLSLSLSLSLIVCVVRHQKVTTSRSFDFPIYLSFFI
jgi:hypothetical protein